MSPEGLPFGIGGDIGCIWHCDLGEDLVYELSTTDFSVVRMTASPASEPRGIGGDIAAIWHCDSVTDLIYELGGAELRVGTIVVS